MPQVSWNNQTFNLVTVAGGILSLGYVVSGSNITANIAPASGDLLFTPSDICYSTSYGVCAFLRPVGITLDGQGQFSCNLFAMDNSGVSANWYWILTGSVNGNVLPKRRLNVLYNAGDAQNLAILLNTAVML